MTRRMGLASVLTTAAVLVSLDAAAKTPQQKAAECRLTKGAAECRSAADAIASTDVDAAIELALLPCKGAQTPCDLGMLGHQLEGRGLSGQAAKVFERDCGDGRRSIACLSVGRMYLEGRADVPASPSRALASFEKACALDSRLCSAAAEMLEFGRGVPQDVARAAQLRAKALEAERRALATRTANPARDAARASDPRGEHEQKCRAQRDAMACVIAGAAKLAGGARDEAVALYTIGCEANPKLCALGAAAGDALDAGDAVSGDQLMTRACEVYKGAVACFLLGANLESGSRGMREDVARAARVYKMACESGEAMDACARLAWMAREGRGIPQDRGLWAELMAKVAQQRQSRQRAGQQAYELSLQEDEEREARERQDQGREAGLKSLRAEETRLRELATTQLNLAVRAHSVRANRERLALEGDIRSAPSAPAASPLRQDSAERRTRIRALLAELDVASPLPLLSLRALPPGEKAPVPVVGATWATTAESQGEDCVSGSAFEYACPPDPRGVSRAVLGTGPYGDVSSVCYAGVHSGRIKQVDGGTVVIELRPAATKYEASKQNGIESFASGAARCSFVVR